MPHKTIVLAFFVISLAFGCNKKKDNYNAQLEADIALIEQYLIQNHIEAQRLENGLHYFIHRQGSDPKPGPNATVTVSYTGKLLNGEIIDKDDFVSFNLQNLIKGWRIGLTLIGTNGRITLFIPSTLGYGNNAMPGIPANAVLIFDLTLHYFSL